MIAKYAQFSPRYRAPDFGHESHCAKRGEIWERDADARHLRAEETTVERGIVGNKSRIAKKIENIAGYFREGRGSDHVPGSDPMNVGWPNVSMGVDQRGILARHRAVSVKTYDRDLDDTIASIRQETSGLEVDDREAVYLSRFHSRILRLSAAGMKPFQVHNGGSKADPLIESWH